MNEIWPFQTWYHTALAILPEFQKRVRQFDFSHTDLIRKIEQNLGKQEREWNQAELSLTYELSAIGTFFTIFRTIEDLRTEGIALYGEPNLASVFPDLVKTNERLSRPQLIELYSRSQVNLHFSKYCFDRMLPERLLTTLAVGVFPLAQRISTTTSLFLRLLGATHSGTGTRLGILIASGHVIH